MQPGAPRPILQKHSKIFLAFCTDFCYTSHVTAARGWEYAHYGSSYLTEEEAGTPDRIKMLGTLKTTIFPLCQSVSVVSINEDHMDITCVLPKGTVLANLIAQIEQDGTVCYVTASLESTKEQEAGSIDAIAAEKPVDVVLSVSFYKPGESGETS